MGTPSYLAMYIAGYGVADLERNNGTQCTHGDGIGVVWGWFCRLANDTPKHSSPVWVLGSIGASSRQGPGTDNGFGADAGQRAWGRC